MGEFDTSATRGADQSWRARLTPVIVGGFVVFFLGTILVRWAVGILGGLALLAQDPSVAEPFTQFSETTTYIWLSRAAVPIMMAYAGFVAVRLANASSAAPALHAGLFGWALGLPALWTSGFTNPTRLLFFGVLLIAFAVVGGLLGRARRITSP